MTATVIHLRCYVGYILMEHLNDWHQAGKITAIVVSGGIVKITTEDGAEHSFYEEGMRFDSDGVHLPGDSPRRGLIPIP